MLARTSLLMMLVTAAVTLTACGGGGQQAAGSGDSAGPPLPMAQAPPDLSAFPGGNEPVIPLSEAGPIPDACSMLTQAMVLALIPGAGGDGNVTTPRSDTRGGTVVTCQYLATPKGSDTQAGNIIVDFSFASSDSPENNQAFFDKNQSGLTGTAGFVGYGAGLGANSLAYFDPNLRALEVLYKGQPFSVTGEGEFPNRDVDKWRDDVDVPVARNIIARMNG